MGIRNYGRVSKKGALLPDTGRQDPGGIKRMQNSFARSLAWEYRV